MTRFKIEYKDPDTDQILVEEQEFFNSPEPLCIRDREWAQDYAYTMANKGWHRVTKLPS